MKLTPAPKTNHCPTCGGAVSHLVMTAGGICMSCSHWGKQNTNAATLEEIAAKRLALLAKRSVLGKSIKRCQALNESGLQCTHFGDIHRGAVWICASHNRQASNEYIPQAAPMDLDGVHSAEIEQPIVEQEPTPIIIAAMPYLRAQQVIKDYPMSIATLWRISKLGLFPKPIKLSPGTTVWVRAEIEAYMEKRKAARG